MMSLTQQDHWPSRAASRVATEAADGMSQASERAAHDEKNQPAPKTEKSQKLRSSTEKAAVGPSLGKSYRRRDLKEKYGAPQTDGVTTLMLRGLPCSLSEQDILARLAEK